MQNEFDFSEALDLLKHGRRVARKGWNGKGQFIEYQQPGAAMTLPFISIRTVDGERVPWLASQTDLLADDWVEVGEEL